MSYIHFHTPLHDNAVLEYNGLSKVVRDIYIESATIKVGTDKYIKTRHTIYLADPNPENFIEYKNITFHDRKKWVCSNTDNILAIETENIRLLELQNDNIQPE